MSFRRRLALSCGAAVAVTVVLGSALAYWVVRDTLRDRLDDSLRTQAAMAPMTSTVAVRGADTLLLKGESPALVRISRFADGTAVSSEKVPAQLGDEREM